MIDNLHDWLFALRPPWFELAVVALSLAAGLLFGLVLLAVGLVAL